MIHFAPGSFRDPAGRVFYHEGRVLRTMSKDAARVFDAVEESGLLAELQASGAVVETERRRVEDLGLSSKITGEVLLEHAPVPFLSYPYEWSFDMLRDAALLTLELLRKSLVKGFILKDGSPYNIQFSAGRPLFIDLLSFEAFDRGVWNGYTQFCRMFLFPLMLTSYKGVRFHGLLRSDLEGISAEDMARLLGWSSIRRRGVLTHVTSQALFARYFGPNPTDLKWRSGAAGLSRQPMIRLVTKLAQLVTRLRSRTTSHWITYTASGHRDAVFHERKLAFVRECLESIGADKVWDLGCNTGEFARLAARYADMVVAMDSDPDCINQLYLDQKAGRAPRNVVGLVIDVANPSPSLGWRLRERSSWLDRGRPDAVLALALMHHLVITRNVPVREFIEFLHSLARHVIVEFVTKADPMVQKLLLNREDVFADYTVENFEAHVRALFTVIARCENEGGTRIIYRLESR